MVVECSTHVVQCSIHVVECITYVVDDLVTSLWSCINKCYMNTYAGILWQHRRHPFNGKLAHIFNNNTLTRSKSRSSLFWQQSFVTYLNALPVYVLCNLALHTWTMFTSDKMNGLERGALIGHCDFQNTNLENMVRALKTFQISRECWCNHRQQEHSL